MPTPRLIRKGEKSVPSPTWRWHLMKAAPEGGVVNTKKIIRAVGRPTKISRDAAVFIAKKWRIQCVGESAVAADRWIVSHWADITPKGEPVGITESAHVRAAVRRAEKTWLGTCELRFNESLRMTTDTFAVMDHSTYDWLPLKDLGLKYETEGCAVLALEVFTTEHEYFVKGFPRACMWMNGMRVVRLCKSIPVHDPSALAVEGISLTDRKGMTQVAAGIAESVGITQLRAIKRLHRGRPKLS